MKLVVTGSAYRDLLQIYAYIAEDSETHAERTVQQIRRRFESLPNFPFLGRQRPDLAEGLRQLNAGQYLVFYRVDEPSVEILRILHGRMDIESELRP
jgi:toxin ParE1/3/4